MPNVTSIHLTVNDQAREARVSPDLFLVDYLRKELKLTGTKNGCNQGHCGTCTVIVDGKAVRSCIVKMARLEGSRVETIEGLARDGKMHPLQEAFVAEGAVQCGFCTPGAIMAAKALLDAQPAPTEKEIRKALKNNLCRCTGYASIVKAVQRAARQLAGEAQPPETAARSEETGDVVGARLVGKDILSKVTGQIQYADDVSEEGMLYGRVLWSDHPHAEILGIDTAAAAQLPGVRAVLTAKDVPGVNRIGILRRDQPAIADRVRFIGDPVAVVIAETEEIARQAVERLVVDYRPLPGVFTPTDAAAPNAPLVHETGNLCHQESIERGNVREAFQKAAVVVEQTYTTPFVEHAFLEPESGIARPTENGGVLIEIGTQCAYDDQAQLCDALALPPEKVRVVQRPMGGAFGGKEDIILHFFLAVGALRTGHPVKMTLERQESLRTHPKRHACTMRYKTAASADGHLLAVESDIVLDTGAYASLGPDILENMLTFGAGPYYVPNLQLAAKAYYTNNVPGGAMRGFGVPQVTFAMESQMDAMARALKMDPFAFRRLNALDVGLALASGHILESSVGIKSTLDAAQAALRTVALPASGKKVGVGVACAVKNLGFGHGVAEDAGAIVELMPQGTFRVRVGISDYGQGSLTAMAQIAAQALGVPYARIKVLGADTALAPRTGPTTASRQTYLSGNALVAACDKLKTKILQYAKEELGLPADGLELKGGKLVHVPTGKSVDLSAVQSHLIAEERFLAPATVPFLREASRAGTPEQRLQRTHWAYSFSTHVAIVEVDEATGVVRVAQFIAAHDVGRAINPQVIEGQIAGGVSMGIGYGLSEAFIVEQGINRTKTLYDCHIPTAEDVPEILALIVEDPEPHGPFGAKGVGEAAALAPAAAVLNAIYDAVGVRITALPATKARVRAALKEAEAKA